MSLYVRDGHLHRVTNNKCHINIIDSPDDTAQICSKHVENLNNYIRKKNCASTWLFTRNEQRCTINRTYNIVKLMFVE
jgi:hypothetical protein